jgi:hypothetical protein
MTRGIVLSITAIILVSLAISFAAISEPNGSAQRATVARRPRTEAVTMAEFYMRDGNAVSGRLLSEDNTQVVIEQPADSALVTKSYSKRELDPRTLKTRPMPESQYYTRIAEYFAARTWDFRDDPDDFISAIRSYEKAKRSLEASGADVERIAEIDRAIKKLEDDREVWTKQVESRASLRKLEYEAEAEKRLRAVEKQVAEASVKLNESIKYLDKTVSDIRNENKQLEITITNINKDFVRQINDLRTRLTNDEMLLNDIWVRLQL